MLALANPGLWVKGVWVYVGYVEERMKGVQDEAPKRQTGALSRRQGKGAATRNNAQP